MKIEVNNQTVKTIAILIILLVVEYLMLAFNVNYAISISIDLALCIFFNIYNYKRFRQFQTKEDLLLINKRLAFAELFTNLAVMIGIVAILTKLC